MTAIYSDGRTVNNNLQSALAIASHGYPVFPVRPDNKRPYSNEQVALVLGIPVPAPGMGGLKLATCDAGAIERLWQAWPDALPAMPTGSRSGVDVLDVDYKPEKGVNGYESLNAWGGIGAMNGTPYQATMRGGIHYLFQHDPSSPLITDTDTFGRGLDTRGENGYIVVYDIQALLYPRHALPEWMRSVRRRVGSGARRPLGDPERSAPSYAAALYCLQALDCEQLSYEEWLFDGIHAFMQSAWLHATPDDIWNAIDQWCKTDPDRYNQSDLWYKYNDVITGGTDKGWFADGRFAAPWYEALLLGTGWTRPDGMYDTREAAQVGWRARYMNGPDAAWNGPVTDEVLLERIKQASPGFIHLENADQHVLAAEYPSSDPVVSLFDHDAVVMAYLAKLAYFTGRDAVRMDRMLKAWLSRTGVTPRIDLEVAIFEACRTCKTVYRGRKVDITVEGELYAPLLTIEEMIDRLIFVRGGKKGVIDRFEKFFMPSENAANYYSASVTEIKSDDGKSSKYLKNLATWLADPRRKTVDTLTWLPGGPEICAPPGSHDRAFNLWRGFFEWPYVPADIAAGYLAIWHDHLRYLIPNPVDREWFEQMLAFKLQHPDVQIAQWVVMVTEKQGTGRGLLGSIIGRVFHGYVHENTKIADLLGLDGGYNAELSQKLFAIVTEAKSEENLKHSKYASINNLNSAVTDQSRKIKMKFGAEWIEYNRMMGIICSNHQDALMFDGTDRRIRVIENPDVVQEQAYYDRIVAALADDRFIGAIYHHLLNMDVSGFKPGAHAPLSEVKKRSIDANKSEADKAAEQFASIWPGRIATTAILRDFVESFTGHMPHSNSMKYLIKTAGMISTDRTVKISLKTDRVLIVRDLTKDDVQNLSAASITMEIMEAKAKFDRL